MSAVANNHFSVVTMLLKYNANVNYITDDGVALMLAVWKDNLEVVNILFVAANVNYVNLFEDTVLIWAVKKGNLEIINILLTHNTNVNHINEDGNTTLVVATESGNLEVVNYY